MIQAKRFKRILALGWFYNYLDYELRRTRSGGLRRYYRRMLTVQEIRFGLRRAH